MHHFKNKEECWLKKKSEIIRRLQLTEEANIKLTKLFKDATRQCKDLQQSQQEDGDNAPRFTLAELREVLQEKNLLKGKVLELEEELEQLRPNRRPESSASDVSSEPTSEKRNDSDECVVYGPINKEPEEKLYPWKYERKDSGVRKFFRFFKEGLNSGGFSPRGSSSPIPSTRMSSLSGFNTSPRS